MVRSVRAPDSLTDRRSSLIVHLRIARASHAGVPLHTSSPGTRLALGCGVGGPSWRRARTLSAMGPDPIDHRRSSVSTAVLAFACRSSPPSPLADPVPSRPHRRTTRLESRSTPHRIACRDCKIGSVGAPRLAMDRRPHRDALVAAASDRRWHRPVSFACPRADSIADTDT